MNTTSKQYDLIIKNSNIIDVETGKIINNTDIAILKDRIIKIGKSIVVDDSVKTIDATGKFVIPGLWDMHVHAMGSTNIIPRLFLANGITGIRNMWGEHPFMDNLKQRIKDNEIFGPEIVNPDGIIDGPAPIWSMSDSIITEKEGREIVREQIKNGADFIKIYNLLSKEAFIGIADECSKQAIPFAGHVPWSITYPDAVNAGIKSIEHLDGVIAYCIRMEECDEKILQNLTKYIEVFFKNLDKFDEKRLAEIIKLTKVKNVWHCSTMTVWKYRLLFEDDMLSLNNRLKYVNSYTRNNFLDTKSSLEHDTNAENRRKGYQLRKNIIKQFNLNNIRFLAGTDLGNPFVVAGFSLHDELSNFVECGFTPLQSLQTATLNPAIFLDRLADFGTVSENKIANLVILDKNPLESINNSTSVNAVIQRGEFYCREKLDNLLLDVKEFTQREPLCEILFKKIQDGRLDDILSCCQIQKVWTDRPEIEQLDSELADLTEKLIKNNDYESAEKIAVLNVHLHLNSARALCKLAECYLKDHNQNEIDEVLKTAYNKSIKPSWELNEIFWLMLKNRSYKLVKEYALKTLEIFPFINNFKFHYAHALLLTGEFEKAKEIYLTYKESLIRENDLKILKEIGIENADLDKMIELVYAKEQG